MNTVLATLYGSFTPILGQVDRVSDQSSRIFDTPIIKGIAAFLAVVVVIMGIIQTVKSVFQGRTQGAFKSIFGTVIIAGLLLNLSLIGSLLTWVAGVVSAIIELITGIV